MPSRSAGSVRPPAAPSAPRGVLLGDLNWMQARGFLTPKSIAVSLLGAQSREHGPRVTLSDDWAMAEHPKARVFERADVVVAPTVEGILKDVEDLRRARLP